MHSSKSLLFYTAGNVYQVTYTMDIEKLGGVIKKMPQTAMLFFNCRHCHLRIPPFNGFISEFIIYTGLYNWLSDERSFTPRSHFLHHRTGSHWWSGHDLFHQGIWNYFLGNARHSIPADCQEVKFIQLLPLYILALVIILIGIFLCCLSTCWQSLYLFYRNGRSSGKYSPE